jgi:O-6-methylguanine DNA methyltransferase
MSFKDKVYQISSQIPKGKVATYGQIASLAGSPGAARAVGLLMKNNPDLKVVPCHRVVASDGKLTGYSAGHGLPTKKAMLLKEGVKFRGNVVDLSTSIWKN